VHAERVHTSGNDCAVVALFYCQLIQLSPKLGIRVGYAAAVAEAEGAEAGLAILEAIASHTVSHYQRYWAVRAHLLQRLGTTHKASDAYDRAVGLTEDPPSKSSCSGNGADSLSGCRNHPASPVTPIEMA
jgi:RNA polymerase sigma-70 factor (ECF subfamily)